MQESYWSDISTQRISRRRGLALTGGTVLGTALLAACGSGKNGTGSGANNSSLVTQSVDTSSQAKRGGTLKDQSNTDTTTFDFSTPIGAISGGAFCYDCLIRVAPGDLKPAVNELEPDMAESWEWSPDGLQITLKLRQGVKFHNKPPVNGRTLDMDDVLFSWKRFADKASNRVNVVNSVNPGAPVLSVTAADSKTIVIKLNEPVSYALELFAPYTGGGNIIMIPKETDTTFDIRNDMIGTGPFMMTNYQQSQAFTFKRHPEYYDKDFIFIDQIEMPIITEYAQTLAQLKAGNIHYFDLIKGEDVLIARKDEPRLLIYPTDLNYPSGTTYGQTFGWLPEGKSPFLDERVRQAVSMSMDRDLWIDTFYNVSKFAAEGLPVESRWNSQLLGMWDGWWLDPKGKDFGPNAKYFQHNIAEGKKLMAAAGYPDGFDVTSHLARPGGPLGTTAQYAAVSDNMMADIGIRVKIDYVDYNTQYIPLYRDGNGQFEGWAYPSISGGSGYSPLRTLAAQYWPKGGVAFKGFSASGKNDQSGDPPLTALIEKARLERDTDRGRALVFDIQRYLAKAMWGLIGSGAATGFSMAWPALGNYRVWRGGNRPYYRLWLDDTKAPFKKA